MLPFVAAAPPVAGALLTAEFDDDVAFFIAWSSLATVDFFFDLFFLWLDFFVVS